MEKYITSKIPERENYYDFDIDIPGDKSISHRAIILSSIANGKSEIKGLLESGDVFATINAFKSMGVNIFKDRSKWIVEGVGLKGLTEPIEPLDMGNSGTSARLIIGILAGQNFNTIIKGDSSLSKRDMTRVTEPLKRMGANFEFLENDGCLPIKIIGNPNLTSISYDLHIASSQIMSSILFAGLYASGETVINNVNKYLGIRNCTETMLSLFGFKIKNSLSKKSIISSEANSINLDIPSDPSSSAFFMILSFLLPKVSCNFKNICCRGNFHTEIIWNSFGKIHYDESKNDEEETFSTNYLKYKNKHKNNIIPFRTSMIDEYPILFILACKKGMKIELNDELKNKESDRINVMLKGLNDCGVDAKIDGSYMIIPYTENIKGGATIKTHGDHRIAMSFIILGLIADNPITIDDVSCIKTSFPNFFEELNKIYNGILYDNKRIINGTNDATLLLKDIRKFIEDPILQSCKVKIDKRVIKYISESRIKLSILMHNLKHCDNSLLCVTLRNYDNRLIKETIEIYKNN